MRLKSLLALATLLLVSCGLPLTRADFDKTPEAQYLMALVEQLQAQNYSFIEGQLDKRVQQQNGRQTLEKMASVIPTMKPLKTEPVDWFFAKIISNKDANENTRTARVAIEYTFPTSKWAIASATLSGEPGNFRLAAFNVSATPAPLAELNAFTFDGKSALHYVFLLLTASAFAISAYAFVRCIKTVGLKRKWLWAIFTLIGGIAFSMNWTNGFVTLDILRFNLPCVSFWRIGWVGPWNVTYFIPIGAIVFLWKYPKASLAARADS